MASQDIDTLLDSYQHGTPPQPFRRKSRTARMSTGGKPPRKKPVILEISSELTDKAPTDEESPSRRKPRPLPLTPPLSTRSKSKSITSSKRPIDEVTEPLFNSNDYVVKKPRIKDTTASKALEMAEKISFDNDTYRLFMEFMAHRASMKTPSTPVKHGNQGIPIMTTPSTVSSSGSFGDGT
ncbi:hypothetical protein BDZ94DRAFT_1294668, partial [Collybia nuda]